MIMMMMICSRALTRPSRAPNMARTPWRPGAGIGALDHPDPGPGAAATGRPRPRKLFHDSNTPPGRRNELYDNEHSVFGDQDVPEAGDDRTRPRGLLNL